MVAGFALLCGFSLLAAWGVQVRDWITSSNWQTTRGTIRGSLVEEAERRDILGAVNGFRPIIRYAYQVDGQTYVSARFSAVREPFFDSKQEAEAFVEKFPVGNHVRVRVNPKRPRQSVLERKITAGDALPGYLALASIFVGLLFI
ncbi:MAG: DUF3592 domain-containing protein [Pseudomonadota bacterium]